ncbi:MAG: hypothetical protein ACJ79H_02755 [Myxococcales bacterium]
MPRTRPSRNFLAREQHRVLLTIHALLMISGLLGCALLNRRFSPDRLWVQWIALGWGALFVVHLWIFSRGTLATMGGRRPSSRWPSSPP